MKHANIRPLYRLLFEPRTNREDSRRKEVILNTLLLASLLLTAVAFLFDTFERIRFRDEYDGIQSFIVPLTFLFFLSLFMLSRRKQIAVPTFMLVALYYAYATYCLFRWGLDVPIGLLIYALVITLSGILGSPRIASAYTLLIVLTLCVLYALGAQGIVHPDLIWKTRQAELVDVPVIGFIFLILFFVSWLSRREIEHSLKRALESEAALKQERDILEITVERRTAELRQAQRAETLQLYELAAVGRLSSSLLHDMLNPLATVSLTLERLRDGEVSDLLERAIRNTRKIEQFVAAARKQIRSGRQTVRFNPAEEVDSVLELLADRLHRAGIGSNVAAESSLSLSGDPVRFHRLVSNLVSNAIDAYESLPVETLRQPLRIQLIAQLPDGLLLTVKDSGCGIPEDLLPRVFEPFYTSKDISRGSGIGLGICKEIAEHDFAGSIRITSSLGSGTSVRATLRDQHA